MGHRKSMKSLFGKKSSEFKILIIRPSSMGDIVMASSMLRPLKLSFPGSYIAWLLEPAYSPILEAHPLVDEIVVWEKKQWQKSLKTGRVFALTSQLLRFSKSLRSKKFDLALEAQGLFRSRLLAWLSGARERVGFCSNEPGRLLMTRMISKGPESKQMGSEYLHMLNEVGAEVGKEFAPDLRVTEQDTATASKKLRRIGIPGKYAVLAPFTTRPQKHWITDRWADVSRRLRETHNISSVLLGGSQDVSKAREIVARSKGTCVSLVGDTTIGETMTIVKEASILVGVDTGITHMGAAFATPTIALFGATCPYLFTSRNNFLVLYHGLPCSPCKRNPTCGGNYYCMEKISVEEVVNAANKVLT
ncbi:MAG: lipopolysaccharide heptosyltransferase [Deltaproteobacteria bacterium]|nr:MAG: lipopolysaccharide heptosyltransferase [Deltaproteobacteria bacterium]